MPILRRFVILLYFCLPILLLPAEMPARAQNATSQIIPIGYLVIGSVGRSGRTPTHTDAIEAQIVAGLWTAPHAGDTVTLPNSGTQAWEAVKADKDGGVTHAALQGNGYAYLSVDAPRSGIYLLEAGGHSMVYVNGEPRAGDPYDFGTVRLPIALRAGHNDLLFSCGRGHLHAKLTPPKGELELDARDSTVPDLIVGDPVHTFGALVAINATAGIQGNLWLSATPKNGRTTVTALPVVMPLSTRKVAFRLEGRAQKLAGSLPIKIELLRQHHGRFEKLDALTINLRVRRPGETYKRTFVSDIDGSVQYYAVNPAAPLSQRDPLPALVLTLHGASVEAIGQADAYERKTWATLVAPTNRRPYGFDWEDWGRMDALEVLADARLHLHTDPTRTYLAGHSMGGHGAWQLGVTYPDHWAAIGPSAGWISFSTYAGGRRAETETANPVATLLARASTPGETLSLAHNYAQEGVYILHGSADDNVPVTEARTMSKELSAFHHDFVYYEQPGAGHWWDVSDEPGADCVDWAPMYDFFARHTLPIEESVRQVDFITANPGISAQDHWASIDAQIHALSLSSVHLRCDPGLRRFSGTTENVARLTIALDGLPAGNPLRLDLDGQKLEAIPWPTARRLCLARNWDRWSIVAPAGLEQKGPQRCGPFKDAFRHRILFVYGTQGNAEENAQCYARARYDAETFWYRGNGSVDLIADTAFLAAAAREPDRSVILYGNADTNAAWKPLLAESPVQVRRGIVQVGDIQEPGDNLACLFLRPRPGSAIATVAAVAGSGLPGMKLTERLPYFVSGVAYPDCIVIGPAMLSRGIDGVRCAGFFGQDWSTKTGEFAWSETGK